MGAIRPTLLVAETNHVRDLGEFDDGSVRTPQERFWREDRTGQGEATTWNGNSGRRADARIPGSINSIPVAFFHEREVRHYVGDARVNRSIEHNDDIAEIGIE